MATRARLPVLRAALAPALAALLLGAAAPGAAEVLLSEQAALERIFPGAQTARRTLYLTPAQLAAVEKAARSRLPSAVVSVYEARVRGALVGRALVDTQVVRTAPATVLAAVNPDGTLRAALVLRFAEPPDYLPRPGWLRTLEGRRLDDELWPGHGVRRVSGATLTVQALTDAVRRALAVEEIVLRGQP